MYLDREMAEKIPKFCESINSFTTCSKTKPLDRLPTAVRPSEKWATWREVQETTPPSNVLSSE